MEIITKDKVNQKDTLKLKRWWALHSLYYLNKYVLFKDVQSPDESKPGPTDIVENHKILCDWVTVWHKKADGFKRKLILATRDFFKTSLVTIGYSIQTLLKNPNDTILIVSQERSFAIHILGLIKKQMEENEELLAINGGSFKGGYGWKEWEIFIRGKKSLAETDPSIGTAGIDAVKAGPHPVHIFLDDPMSEKNTSNDEMKASLIRNYRYLSPMLKKLVGQLLIIGTPYAFGDLYNYILSTPAELKDFEVFLAQAQRMSAVLPSINSKIPCVRLPKGKEGTMLIPNRIPKKFLEDEIDKDPVFATSQYLVGLVSDKSAEFKKEWFKYYISKNLPNDLLITTAVDPAISKKKTADYLAIVTIGQDRLGNVFILNLIRDRFDPDEFINKLYEIQFEYRPRTIAIESNGFQKLLAFNILKEGKIRGLLPIQPIEHYGSDNSKAARIRKLIPTYKQGQLYHLGAGEGYLNVDPSQRILESELLQFRGDKSGGHDDVIDALAMCFEVIQPQVYFEDIFPESYVPSDSLTGY